MGKIMQKMLDYAIKDAVYQGFQIFYIGMAQGFDIIAGEAILRIKAEGLSEIKLNCILPFKGQDGKWSKDWRRRHDLILRAADSIEIINDAYTTGCYHERNRFLVDNAQRLIVLYSGKQSGTGHTVAYARKKGIEIVNLWEGLDEYRRKNNKY